MFVLPVSRSLALQPRGAFASAVDRLFDDSFDRFFSNVTAETQSRTPAIDVTESDAAYTVAFDVPGASREQLKVSVEGRRVTLVSADSKADASGATSEVEGDAAGAKKADRVLYRERSFRGFARTIVLPTEVDQAASNAKFENGVLTLTLAKKVPAGATQLQIG